MRYHIDNDKSKEYRKKIELDRVGKGESKAEEMKKKKNEIGDCNRSEQ